MEMGGGDQEKIIVIKRGIKIFVLPLPKKKKKMGTGTFDAAARTALHFFPELTRVTGPVTST